MTKRSNGKGYVLCVSNRGYQTSLRVRRIYRAISDETAAREGLVRVIDETGEDYLFPQKFFVVIDVPKEAGRAFRAAS